ncbi:hypothetical protein CR513_27519, partial [Mucuna pruriens]
MPSSIYKSLNFGNLEPMGIVIQLANKSVVQPLGILEDVLVQVNELIFPADFYVLNIEDKTSRKGSTLILGRPFLMTATLPMEFGNNLVQFNNFEAMKHLTEDHSLFGVDIIDELVKECMQLDIDSVEIFNFVELIDVTDYFNTVTNIFNSINMCDGDLECSHCARIRVANIERPVIAQLEIVAEPESDFDQTQAESDSHDQMKELSTTHQIEAIARSFEHFPVIIANNLHREQEEKLLNILRKHKKEIGWTRPTNKATTEMTESNHPRCRQERSDETTCTWDHLSLLEWPMGQSDTGSSEEVLTIVMKNRHDELVPTRIQNSWRVCIDYRKLNKTTRKDHFPLLSLTKFWKD